MSVKRVLKDILYKWKFCVIWYLIIFVICMFTRLRFSLTLNLVFITVVMFPFVYVFLAILYSKLSGGSMILALIGDFAWLYIGWGGYFCLIRWLSEIYSNVPYLRFISDYSGNLITRYDDIEWGIRQSGLFFIFSVFFLSGMVSFYALMLLYWLHFYLEGKSPTIDKTYAKKVMRDKYAPWILGSASFAPVLLNLHPIIPPVLAILVISICVTQFSIVNSEVKDRKKAALGVVGKKLAVYGNLVMYCRERDLFTCIDSFLSIGESLTEISYGPYMVCTASEYHSHVLAEEGRKPDALILDYEEQDMDYLLPEERIRLMDEIKIMIKKGKRVFIYYRIQKNEKGAESRETRELRKLPITFLEAGVGDVDELKKFLTIDSTDSWKNIRELVYRKIEQVPNTLKYQFISQKRESVCNAEKTEAFYQCIKMAEYMIHYRALAKLVYGEVDETTEITFSLGTWQKIQREATVQYESLEILEAERLIRKLLEQRDCSLKSVLTYKEITEIIVRLRNRYIGHGTLTYSVSEELITAVVILTGAIYQVFSHDGYELDPTQLMNEKYLMGGAVPVCRIDDGQISLLYFVTYTEMGNLCEYVNYNNGLISKNMDIVKWHLISGGRR